MLSHGESSSYKVVDVVEECFAPNALLGADGRPRNLDESPGLEVDLQKEKRR